MLNGVVDNASNISVISKIEVLRFNAAGTVYRVLEDFIKESNVIGLNELVVEKTIAVCKAHRIKLPDAIIAATALVYDFTLITRNISDFKNIKDLDFINPWDI